MPTLTPVACEAATPTIDRWTWNDPAELHEWGDEIKSETRDQHAMAHDKKRWGIILAGGDDARPSVLTRLIYGSEHPRQFCRPAARHTLLEQTQQRAARSISPEQTIVAVTKAHQDFYETELGGSFSYHLVQPCSRGTAPPIILSLLHITSYAPDALVAILPSDHYYSDEASFTASLESAFRLAHAERESIVLLGARPRGPEVDYGWIDLGRAVGENLFRVRAFEEKPDLALARRLLRSGALWNTFAMVGSATAFLWMTFVSLPELVAELEESSPLCDGNGNLRVPAALYRAIPATDYSQQVLTHNPHRLLALRLADMEWHDFSHLDRVVSALSTWDNDPLTLVHARNAARCRASGRSLRLEICRKPDGLR